jgi:hypothetical protein
MEFWTGKFSHLQEYNRLHEKGLFAACYEGLHRWGEAVLEEK